MGVLFQAFYWNCPGIERKEGNWWNEIRDRVPSLAQAGVTALWLPPACKAANIGGMSMGYDPYDYYDLGEFDQKGSVKTWYGSRDELVALIAAAHEHGLQVYADMVLNHNSGGDELELNPIDKKQRWTRFNPKSGKFNRTWECFHPSWYETFDEATFGDMPDLCHRNPVVYEALIDNARWLLEEIGFDGFRLDFVKGYGGWMVRAIQELRGLRGEANFKPFSVGECWNRERDIDDWLDETNAWSDNPVSAFDFPLRDRLKDLCDTFGYSLTELAQPGTLSHDQPLRAVTFVENHDTAGSSPIINDKMLAYAVILTHEGYPCVFWQDYYNWDLAQEGKPSGIAALIQAHERYASGASSVLWADHDLYVVQRNGSSEKPGLILVLNNRDSWNGTRVRSQWPDARLSPFAWRGRSDPGVPEDKWSDADGTVELWAPPRGYVVYVPTG